VCDLLAGVPPTNITNSPGEIDDDASWSPDGQKIAWTAHDVGDDPLVIPSQEIYLMNADGSGRVNLTNSVGVEERGPAWSPDGTRIAYMCRVGLPPAPGGNPTFEICVMNADGSGVTRLTDNTLPDGTPTWSPDGTKIVFNRAVPPPNQQLFIMNADGSGLQTQLTFPPGFNLFASFGEIKAGRVEEP
jgi:TolB protein